MFLVVLLRHGSSLVCTVDISVGWLTCDAICVILWQGFFIEGHAWSGSDHSGLGYGNICIFR